MLLLVVLLCGCGSKVSRANYYRVQYGMTEQDVEDLLGPPHAVGESPSTTQPVMRKTQTWSRDGLVIRVVFEQGVVVGRSAEGIAAEAGTSTSHPAA
jgi:hypothetical protein